jgi:hypothetical protein
LEECNFKIEKLLLLGKCCHFMKMPYFGRLRRFKCESVYSDAWINNFMSYCAGFITMEFTRLSL